MAEFTFQQMKASLDFLDQSEKQKYCTQAPLKRLQRLQIAIKLIVNELK